MTTANGPDDAGAIVARVVIAGDLAKLSDAERARYYVATCESLGLNPHTQPFGLIVLNSKLQLYAKKDCAEQLRRRDGITLAILAREVIEDVYVVTARASLPSGRTDESTGCVGLGGLKGDARANAMMKAETKAKRRVTLSICGLGFLDESEIEAAPDAVVQAPPAPPATTGNGHARALPAPAPKEEAKAPPPEKRTPELPKRLAAKDAELKCGGKLLAAIAAEAERRTGSADLADLAPPYEWVGELVATFAPKAPAPPVVPAPVKKPREPHKRRLGIEAQRLALGWSEQQFGDWLGESYAFPDGSPVTRLDQLTEELCAEVAQELADLCAQQGEKRELTDEVPVG